jgi:3-hydroxybutyryl-CoA dehydrogenase
VRVDEVRRIAVVGAGVMGHGIAQEFALAGYEVTLVSRSESSLQRGVQGVRENLARLAERGMVSADRAESVPDAIYTTTVLEEAAEESDIVVEAVYEELEVKKRVFRELDKICPDRTVLASTTSTLMPSDLASATQRPDKVLVAHYVNPPYLVPLVEVVPGKATSEETVNAVRDLLTAVGKRPVVLGQELPGFVSVRLQWALLREAMSLVQRGVVSPQDVDLILRDSLGRRWSAAGVFETLELAGWDLISAVASRVVPDLESSTAVPRLLYEKVERGELGVKTGKGFYDWTPESTEALRRRITHALVEVEGWSREP